MTDAGSFAVYDPTAIPERIPPTGPRKLEEWLAKQVEVANLLLFDPHADGDYWLQLFVEEEMPKRLAGRAKHRMSGHLRVPGGRVFAVGAEDLAGHSGHGPNAVPKMGGQAMLAPGTYRVDAFTADWHGREINAEIRKQTNPKTLKSHQRKEALMVVVFYATVFGSIGFFVKLAKYGSAYWHWWLAVLVLLWCFVLLLFQWYRRSEIQRIRERVESEFPCVILHFRKPEPQAGGDALKGFKLDLDE